MNWWDIVILLATGLVALYLIWRFVQDYRRSPDHSFNIFYIIAFAVLLVAGLLLIFFTYDVLSNDLVVIVSALIPLALSVGLVAEFIPKWKIIYLIFAIIGFAALAVTRYVDFGPANLATIVLIIVHAIAGLLIFGIPIAAVANKRTVAGFLWVSVGGVLIDIGGVALAFLKMGRQLLFLSADMVFTILAPLLLLMALAFTWGFVKKMLAKP